MLNQGCLVYFILGERDGESVFQQESHTNKCSRFVQQRLFKITKKHQIYCFKTLSIIVQPTEIPMDFPWGYPQNPLELQVSQTVSDDPWGSLAPREAKLFCEALGGFGGSAAKTEI